MAILPSRNRRFDLYEDPRLRRALDAQRLLEAIRRDLERPGLSATLRVRPVRLGHRRRYRLEYENPAFRCARISFLRPGELRRLRAMVNGAGERLRLEDEGRAVTP